MTDWDDRAKMSDALDSQKRIAEEYNRYAGECTSQERKDRLLDILSEEHEMQFEIYSEMKRHGWYQVQQASADDVQQVRTESVRQQKNL